jgi:hypothetical protein
MFFNVQVFAVSGVVSFRVWCPAPVFYPLGHPTPYASESILVHHVYKSTTLQKTSEQKGVSLFKKGRTKQ